MELAFRAELLLAGLHKPRAEQHGLRRPEHVRREHAHSRRLGRSAGASRGRFAGVGARARQFAVDACSDFDGVGPHLTTAGNPKLAAEIATAFAN